MCWVALRFWIEITFNSLTHQNHLTNGNKNSHTKLNTLIHPKKPTKNISHTHTHPKSLHIHPKTLTQKKTSLLLTPKTLLTSTKHSKPTLPRTKKLTASPKYRKTQEKTLTHTPKVPYKSNSHTLKKLPKHINRKMTFTPNFHSLPKALSYEKTPTLTKTLTQQKTLTLSTFHTHNNLPSQYQITHSQPKK